MLRARGPFERIEDVLTPRSHAALLENARAHAIVSRLRIMSVLLAVLMLAWIQIDAFFMPVEITARLAVTRVAAAAALFILAAAVPGDPPGLGDAYRRLACFFAIPTAFFLVSNEILKTAGGIDVGGPGSAAYAVLPFLGVALLALFPLVAFESALIAVAMLGLGGWAIHYPSAFVAPVANITGLWLMLVIAAIATGAGMNQVDLMTALMRQLTRDPLTKCYRRESGRLLLEMQYQVASRMQQPLAVVFGDIDRFKGINDVYGHEAGDAVLAGAAARIREKLRAADALVRWGGEEFVIVLPQTSAADAVVVIERIRAAGLGPRPDGTPVTVSWGIAERGADGCESIEALVNLADGRMYRAKQEGRDRLVDFGPAMLEPRAA